MGLVCIYKYTEHFLSGAMTKFFPVSVPVANFTEALSSPVFT